MSKVGAAFIYDKNNGNLKEIDKATCIKVSSQYAPIDEAFLAKIFNGKHIPLGNAPAMIQQKLNNMSYEDLTKAFKYKVISANTWVTQIPNGQFLFVGLDKTREDIQKIIDKRPQLQPSQAKVLTCKKKVYRVKIEKSIPGQAYYNRFKDAHYTGDGQQMVITGTRGEQWLIKPEEVASKYKNVGGNVYETLPSAETVNATPVADGTQVKTSWGTVLTAKNSIKVWPVGHPEDAWFVERSIFNDTYQLA